MPRSENPFYLRRGTLPRTAGSEARLREATRLLQIMRRFDNLERRRARWNYARFVDAEETPEGAVPVSRARQQYFRDRELAARVAAAVYSQRNIAQGTLGRATQHAAVRQRILSYL